MREQDSVDLQHAEGEDGPPPSADGHGSAPGHGAASVRGIASARGADRPGSPAGDRGTPRTPNRGDRPRAPRTVPTAVLLGVAGMLGAGVFLGPAPAAALAGRWYLPALLLTALATTCFVVGSAGASAWHAEPAGSYAYIRDQLGPVPGRMAAALVLAGRCAAAAAIAGALANYLLPAQPTVAAVALVALGTAFNASGRRLGRWSRLPVLLVVVVLGLVVVTAFAIDPPAMTPVAPPGEPGADDVRGMAAAAAVAFFHFAGFERLTSPLALAGRFPQRVLRIALPLVVLVALAAQLVVGAALLRQLGPARLAISPAPLRDLLVAADATALEPLVVLAAVAAMAPMLVVALAGVRASASSVIRGRDVPLRISLVTGPGGPWRLDVVGGGVAAALAVALGPTHALQLAACCLLFYYAFASAGARLVLLDGPSWPMRSACLGMGLAVILAMSSPAPYLVATLAIAASGVALGALMTRWWR
ncbi:hypothetical protein [Streptoalloteichus hindustanus]|uniref:Basic amino acid/polyamine antiporter, APA family n=1 Tax=Streptoalloteichus hindustanus TaxID=2017 RepID=A0A1M5BUA9_STRHI|nr:hypothetical protein [Streptoalloteichus hindustanus]SHF45857.1 basic amino acid/polyamine antiporter, APA family [Streptoalloteichus hindustanus]